MQSSRKPGSLPGYTGSAGTSLLERDSELARLSQLAALAREGGGSAAVVEGPPGIGKTALLAAVGELAARAGFEVLAARGAEREQDFAFGLVRQLFEVAVASVPDGERRELLAGAASIAGPIIDPAQPPAGTSADTFPLVHGLYWLAANLAERQPLALIIDDLHWADAPSLRWLGYLCRRLDGVALLVAMAARSTVPEAPVLLIEVMKAESDCKLVHPAPLSERASAAFLGSRLGHEIAPEFSREAHLVTGGNPFLLCELARSVAADGLAPDAEAAERLHEVTPEAIARSVMTRLERLPVEAGRLARAAALLGDDAEIRHLAALAGLSEGQALAEGDLLVAAGLLDRSGPRPRFTHPLLRQVLYAELPYGERAGRHKEAARMLAREPLWPEWAAAHLLAAVPAGDPWVVDHLRKAAAAASGAPEVAAVYLRRALEEPPGENLRPAVLLELGQAEAKIADPGAVVHLEAASELAGDPGQKGAALGTLTFFRHMTGDSAQAVAAAGEALTHIAPGTGGEYEARLVVSYCLAGRPVPELVGDVRRLLEVSRAGPNGEMTPAESARLALAALEHLLNGRRGPAADALRSVMQQRSMVGDDGLPPALIGSFLSLLGHHSEAKAELERALEQARRSGSHLDILPVFEGRTHLRWRSGDLTGAAADAAMVIELCEELAPGAWGTATVPTRAARGICLVELGDLDSGSRALELPQGLETRLPGTWGWLWLPYGRAILAIARGEWAEAKKQALACGERLSAVQVSSPDYLPWRTVAARALSRCGEQARAIELARVDLALSRKSGSTRATGMARMTIGILEGGLTGLDELQEAVRLLEPSPARLEHARALCELGSALRRTNQRAKAREPLQQALEVARACGARPLVERAHAELRATGARPRSLVFTGIHSLTARERQVAELAAGGRSNPEIAQDLFVTRKTVETHLGSVYRKLDLGSREGLSEALRAQHR